MNITTYNNASDKHVLDKDITKVNDSVAAVLKDDTSIINPVLIVSGSLAPTYNYLYIDTFDRYYFVDNVTYSQQRYYIECSVDPLMSFKTAIEALQVIANRSSSRSNVYQQDNYIPFKEYNIVYTQKFPYGFGSPSMLLAVNGKGA